eukprot:gene26196-32731_t
MSAFVTEPDIVATSVFSKYYSSSPPKSYVQVDSSESDWPLSDFIRQHIIDNKVNTDAMTRKEFKKTILRSRSAASIAAAVAEENRSRANSRNSRGDSPSQTNRTNSNNRQAYQSDNGDNYIANPSRFSPVGGSGGYSDGEDEEVFEEVDDEYLNHQIAVDYAYELSRQSPTGSHKARSAALEAADKRRSSVPVKQPSPVQQSAHTPVVKINTPRAKYSYASNNKDSYETSLDDLTIATSELSNRASRAGAAGGKGSSGNKPAVGFGSSSVKEVAKPVPQTAVKKSNAQMTDRVEAEVQKRLDARLNELVDQRVAEAVLEVTQKYDFIINKLVAAVDAEFTLLNNQLRLAQQTSSSSSSPARQQQNATDPVTTIAIFDHLQVEPALYVIVVGVSILDDAVSIIMFNLFNSFIVGEGEQINGNESSAVWLSDRLSEH